MSSLNEDHNVEQKPQDTAETIYNKFCYYTKECLKILYKYSLGSCIHSKRCPCVARQRCTCTCSQSNKDAELEMADISNSKPNTEIKERKDCETCMKKAVNYHYQSHVKKWSQHQKFPWKVILHLLLVALVTIQVS